MSENKTKPVPFGPRGNARVTEAEIVAAVEKYGSCTLASQAKVPGTDVSVLSVGLRRIQQIYGRYLRRLEREKSFGTASVKTAPETAPDKRVAS